MYYLETSNKCELIFSFQSRSISIAMDLIVQVFVSVIASDINVTRPVLMSTDGSSKDILIIGGFSL